MNDKEVIKTYIWHGEKCFFVSTIERDSSVPIVPAPRFNETIVWAYDWKTNVRGPMLIMLGDAVGSLTTHQHAVDQLYKFGIVKEPE
jgi:hypothetical protein